LIAPQQLLTSIDMFSGCGGMSLGLENAGFRIMHANELNQDAAATYRYNFPNVKLENRDVRRIHARWLQRRLGISGVDLIAAGPPCQGFSIAGRRRPRDPRNLLYKEVIRFVKVFRPKIVVIENVVGMLFANHGETIDKVLSALREVGYHPHLKVLSASDYGVPQARKRVFIIATSIRIPPGDLFPRRTRAKKISVKDAISDLAFLNVGEQSSWYKRKPRSNYQRFMRKDASILFNHEAPAHSRKIQRRFASIPIGKNGKDVLRRVKTSKRTYFKLHPHKVSRSLTTLPEDSIHYLRNRVVTVREMARLQSIPDDFKFLGPRTTGGPRRTIECPQYTQVGNAVPPLLAERVFRTIGHAITRYY